MSYPVSYIFEKKTKKTLKWRENHCVDSMNMNLKISVLFTEQYLFNAHNAAIDIRAYSSVGSNIYDATHTKHYIVTVNYKYTRG